MKRNEPGTSPNLSRPKSSNPSTSGGKDTARHQRSERLRLDARATADPRHVEVVHKAEYLVLVKIYPGPGAPGSELMTVACVNARSEREAEMRFDEKLGLPIQFKKMSDEERVASAKKQLERAGGMDAFVRLMLDLFPKLGS